MNGISITQNMKIFGGNEIIYHYYCFIFILKKYFAQIQNFKFVIRIIKNKNCAINPDYRVSNGVKKVIRITE